MVRQPVSTIKKAMIVHQYVLSHLSRRGKVWNMMGKPSQFRGQVALVEQGTNKIVGVAYMDACQGPLFRDMLVQETKNHGFSERAVEAGALIGKSYNWSLVDAFFFKKPIEFPRKNGQTIWANLDVKTRRDLARALTEEQLAQDGQRRVKYVPTIGPSHKL